MKDTGTVSASPPLQKGSEAIGVTVTSGTGLITTEAVSWAEVMQHAGPAVATSVTVNLLEANPPVVSGSQR